MRNHYEYEVGHFENALEIPADTFREQLPKAVEMMQSTNKEIKKKPISTDNGHTRYRPITVKSKKNVNNRQQTYIKS